MADNSDNAPADVGYVSDGKAYPDEFTAIADQHPNIPPDLKRILITRPSQNIEDRRQQSAASTAVHFIADSLQPAAIADLIQNPLNPEEAATASQEPVPETDMSRDLGSGSIPETPRSFTDKLLGRRGDRYQLWPERVIRSLIDDVGTLKKGYENNEPFFVQDPNTGEMTVNPPLANATASLAMNLVGAPFRTAKAGETVLGSGVVDKQYWKDFVSNFKQDYPEKYHTLLEDPEVTALGKNDTYDAVSKVLDKVYSYVGEPPKGFSDPTIPGTPAFDKKYGYLEDSYYNDHDNMQKALDAIQQILDRQESPKKSSGFDYEQMGNGKFEVFDPLTGKTHATVDTEEQAKAAVGVFNKTPNPFEQKPLFYDEKTNNWYDDPEFTKPAGGNAKTIPITEGDSTKGWEDYVDAYLEKEKKTPKEAFLDGVEQAQLALKATFANIVNQFRNVASSSKLEGPVVQPRGEYTEPAYRGMTVYGPNGVSGTGPNPIYKYEGLHYSTANPQLADMYASYLSYHPGYHVPEKTFAEGAQVLPLLINTKDYLRFDAKGNIWQKANPEAIKLAKQQGKKGVIVDNVWDEPNSTTALGKPNRIFITFPEGASTVKSRFASKFDPSSPNMLHTGGGFGIGTPATGYITKEDTNSN